jgi:hypothetical protein
MKPRILFVVMSAVAKAETIDQLARALAPHTVLVHHDFAQTPAFHLSAANVRFVADPKQTGWAMFGFVEGIFHSMAYALEHLDFDYLQLLSPSCLPFRPLGEFEAHVAGPDDAHFDCVDLFGDRDALMSVGYRALTPERSFRHRVARRLTTEYFRGSAGRREEAGIWLHSGGGDGVVAWLAVLFLKLLQLPAVGRHVFEDAFRPYYGSTWFGARRTVVRRMVDLFERPRLRNYFSRLRIADEFMIPTLLMAACSRRGRSNHFVKSFDQAHPGVIQDGDLEQLALSGAFFARKFPDDPMAPVRLVVLAGLSGAGSRSPQPVERANSRQPECVVGTPLSAGRRPPGERSQASSAVSHDGGLARPEAA